MFFTFQQCKCWGGRHAKHAHLTRNNLILLVDMRVFTFTWQICWGEKSMKVNGEVWKQESNFDFLFLYKETKANVIKFWHAYVFDFTVILEWMCMFPPKFLCRNLILNVCEGDGVMTVALSYDSARNFLCSFCHMRTQWELKWWPSPNCQHFDLWSPQSMELWKINLLFINDTVCGSLL